jgi:hypothetical protein
MRETEICAHWSDSTRAAYVAISRAREGAAIYTDSRAKLTEALGLRDGAQVGAIDETMGREGGRGIGLTPMGMAMTLG